MTRLSKESFETMLEIALTVGLIEHCQAPITQPTPDRQEPVTERTNEPKEQKERTERTTSKAKKKGDSVSKSLSGVGSAVEDLAKTRSAAALKLAHIMAPIFSKDPAQKDKDQGALNRWWAEIWPEGASREVAEYRWNRFITIVLDAKAKAKRPMAYIQKRFSEIK